MGRRYSRWGGGYGGWGGGVVDREVWWMGRRVRWCCVLDALQQRTKKKSDYVTLFSSPSHRERGSAVETGQGREEVHQVWQGVQRAAKEAPLQAVWRHHLRSLLPLHDPERDL